MANLSPTGYRNAMPNPLPEFERPPLDEMAIGVQFEPLTKFHAAHAGLYWQRIRDRYPQTQEQPPLPPVVEQLSAMPMKVGIGLMSGLPIPRTWFLSRSGDQLIQVQRNRFLRNWRSVTGSEVYPRYSTLVAAFRNEWDEFRSFVRVEELGELKVNQCELTYVDNIERNPEEFGNLWEVFTFLHPQDQGFLPRPEMTGWEARYKLPNDRGRLILEMNPAFRGRDMKMVISFNMTARGAPEGGGDDQIFAWFDLAHEWINRAFDQLTTSQMHISWKKVP